MELVSRHIRCYLGTQEVLVHFFFFQMIRMCSYSASPQVLVNTGVLNLDNVGPRGELQDMTTGFIFSK